MSHELRTPLNSIIGFTGILLQRLAGPLNDEQRKQLGMVQDSARHLLCADQRCARHLQDRGGRAGHRRSEPFASGRLDRQGHRHRRATGGEKGAGSQGRVEPAVMTMVGDSAVGSSRSCSTCSAMPSSSPKPVWSRCPVEPMRQPARCHQWFKAPCGAPQCGRHRHGHSDRGFERALSPLPANRLDPFPQA
jgi:hypothetical protein